jgi:ParB-like chromosome segregation protein Spo0J
MKSEKRKLKDLRCWDKNPRAIKEVDFERLKRLIKKLGLFKPFLITEDGTILGGNMRYRACLDLGLDEVPVSVVKAETEQKRTEFALADNDRAGYYEEDKLAELVLSLPELELEDFKVDLGYQSKLIDAVNLFAPSQNDIENLSEEDLEKYLEENQDKEMIKIITTVDNARLIMGLIEKNRNGEADDGSVLLNMMK